MKTTATEFRKLDKVLVNEKRILFFDLAATSLLVGALFISLAAIF